MGQSYELPLFLLMGLVGGCLGAYFNKLNMRLTQLRMRTVHRHKVPGRILASLKLAQLFRLIEVAAVAALVSSVGFSLALVWQDCRPIADVPETVCCSLHSSR